MPTSKKKASKAKASAKKTSAKKSVSAAKHKIAFVLDPKKIEAIRRCLDKGTLRVTVSRADLLKGRIRDPWLYD